MYCLRIEIYNIILHYNIKMIQNPYLLNQLNLQKRQELLRQQHLQRQANYQNQLEEDRKRQIEELVNTSVIKNNVVLTTQTQETEESVKETTEQITEETEESEESGETGDSISHLKKIVKDYLKVDNDIKERQQVIKNLRDQQKIRKEYICKFMKTNDLEDINSKTGRLRYNYKEAPKALTEKKTIEYIIEYFGNSRREEADKLIETILAKRESRQVESLRRLKIKKKKDEQS